MVRRLVVVGTCVAAGAGAGVGCGGSDTPKPAGAAPAARRPTTGRRGSRPDGRAWSTATPASRSGSRPGGRRGARRAPTLVRSGDRLLAVSITADRSSDGRDLRPANYAERLVMALPGYRKRKVGRPVSVRGAHYPGGERRGERDLQPNSRAPGDPRRRAAAARAGDLHAGLLPHRPLPGRALPAGDHGHDPHVPGAGSGVAASRKRLIEGGAWHGGSSKMHGMACIRPAPEGPRQALRTRPPRCPPFASATRGRAGPDRRRRSSPAPHTARRPRRAIRSPPPASRSSTATTPTISRPASCTRLDRAQRRAAGRDDVLDDQAAVAARPAAGPRRAAARPCCLASLRTKNAFTSAPPASAAQATGRRPSSSRRPRWRPARARARRRARRARRNPRGRRIARLAST